MNPINMKRILSLTLFSAAILASVAQGVPTAVVGQQIEVSYKYSHPVQTMRSAVADVTNDYILITDGYNSKFYSPHTEMIDSIESTPEGFEAFNTFKRECWESGRQKDIPRVDGSFYITKFSKKGQLHTYDVASATRFHIVESIPKINWEIEDSVRNILGYDCQMATTDFRGRNWTAWFATEIPVQDGPWKLAGLPGIILAAECEGGQYTFEADGIRQTSKPVKDIYGKDNWEAIDRRDFWRLRRECLDNPSRNIKSAGSNVIVFQGIEYKDYLPAEVVDYIETDYK